MFETINIDQLSKKETENYDNDKYILSTSTAESIYWIILLEIVIMILTCRSCTHPLYLQVSMTQAEEGVYVFPTCKKVHTLQSKRVTSLASKSGKTAEK